MTNKGFTLLETLLTVLIVTSLTLVTLSRVNNLDLEWIVFSNEYLSLQADSLINKKTNYLDNYDVHFNENGRVNRAQTIEFRNKKLVIHLGNGYISYEE